MFLRQFYLLVSSSANQSAPKSPRHTEKFFYIAVHERRQLLWHGLHMMALHVCMLQICKLSWNRYLRSCTAMWKPLSLNHRNTFCVHQHGDRDTDVSGKLTEIYGTASIGVRVCFCLVQCAGSTAAVCWCLLRTAAATLDDACSNWEGYSISPRLCLANCAHPQEMVGCWMTDTVRVLDINHMVLVGCPGDWLEVGDSRVSVSYPHRPELVPRLYAG